MSNDININESAILETLNAKIDYDGGNYKGSGLANYVVDKTGDTITGYLTGIANLFPFIAQSNVVDITTTPTTENQFIGYDCRDKNGTRVGWCGVVNHTNGSKYFQVQNQGGVDGFMFPKCTTKATTTSSASNHKVAVIVKNYVSGTSWYRVWSDGWIEQGGRVNLAQDASTTISLLVSFTNTNATAVASNYHNGAHDTNYMNSVSCYFISKSRLKISHLSAASSYTWYACGY